MNEYIKYANEEEMDMALREIFIRGGIDKVRILEFDTITEYISMIQDIEFDSYGIYLDMITFVAVKKSENFLGVMYDRNFKNTPFAPINRQGFSSSVNYNRTNHRSSIVNDTMARRDNIYSTINLIPIGDICRLYKIIHHSIDLSQLYCISIYDKNEYYYLNIKYPIDVDAGFIRNLKLSENLLKIFSKPINPEDIANPFKNTKVYSYTNPDTLLFSEDALRFIIKTIMSINVDHSNVYEILNDEISKYKPSTSIEED